MIHEQQVVIQEVVHTSELRKFKGERKEKKETPSPQDSKNTLSMTNTTYFTLKQLTSTQFLSLFGVHLQE